MKVLGIDPGIKNMGMCVANVTQSSVTIVSWSCVEIDDSSSQRFTKSFGDAMSRVLGETSMRDIDEIRVETQPTKNYRMKRVQHYIEMYIAFTHPNLDVIQFVSPQKKKRVTNPQTDSYYRRKQASIQYVETYLEESNNSMWKTLFHSHEKKDDLAESLLLILIV